jgi:predicted nucleotidyltransferase
VKDFGYTAPLARQQPSFLPRRAAAILSGMKERRHSHHGLAEVTVWVPAEKIEAVKSYVRRIAHRRQPPNREAIFETLRQHRHTLDRFGVVGLSLFGSSVRNEAQAHSDIDLLVTFAPNRPSGLFEFVELKHVLEGLLGRPVDLTTAANLKPRIKSRILAEAVAIY